MGEQLGIDFGTSNTVVAAWDELRRESVLLHIPALGQYSELPAVSPQQPTFASVPVIPSLIHYASDGQLWLGSEVLKKNLASSDRTFSLIKRYIVNRSPVARCLNSQRISFYDAGRDFLLKIVQLAAAEIKTTKPKIAVSVPVESFEHYADWLSRVVESSGAGGFELIDEPSAAALGYGDQVESGRVCLIFDFGGGTLDVGVVLFERSLEPGFGRNCRIIGKAGRDIGGSTIDTWLMKDALRRNDHGWDDSDTERTAAGLLLQCRSAKEELSYSDYAKVHIVNPESGRVLSASWNRTEFEALLNEYKAADHIDRTLGRAIKSAEDRGYKNSDIDAILMIGGSSLIPFVRKTLTEIFGSDKIKLDRPLDAVARGAATFAAGVQIYDHIQHDYAIRWIDPQTGDYAYRVIVRRGTPFPTRYPVARVTIKATNPGQTELGLAIFEQGQREVDSEKLDIELIFDASGQLRVIPVTKDEQDRRSAFWVNEKSPTFLRACPPASRGEPRYAAEFSIDRQKRLLITARDLVTGRVTHREYPVIKLR